MNKQTLLKNLEEYKTKCNLKAVLITTVIFGGYLYYWLNSIRDCVCVNENRINIIEKYYMIQVLMTILKCTMFDETEIGLILSIMILLINILYIYNVRELINEIYKENCECGNTIKTNIMNVLNYMNISYYIIFCMFIILSFILLK